MPEYVVVNPHSAQGAYSQLLQEIPDAYQILSDVVIEIIDGSPDGFVYRASVEYEVR